MELEAITKRQLDVAVKALAKVNRPAAEKILAKFGALTTPELKSEDIPAAHAEFVEALKLEASTP